MLIKDVPPPIPEKDKNLDRAEILNVAKSVNTNLKTINILIINLCIFPKSYLTFSYWVST